MQTKILISGANGFIAGHTIEATLARGHAVVGTVRDPSDLSKTAHLWALTGAVQQLTLVAADLTDQDPFSAHVDVDTIMHMASPYAIDVKDPQRDLVEPAVKGTLSMLRAAAQSRRVKRVILTSSMAAVTDQPDGRVLTEKDWNTRSSLRRNPYYYSKAMAERAAWDFVEREKPAFDLVVINPFMVIGPSLTAALNASNRILVDIIKGRYPAIMALTWGFVDVRDVAAAHIAAMNNTAANGRYVCASDCMAMGQVVGLLRECGYNTAKLPKIDLSGPLGTTLMRWASCLQPAGTGSYLRTHLGAVPNFDNSKIKRDLGVAFRTPEESIRDTVADLERWGHISR